MIVTKNWLNEWIDLEGVETQTIYKTLNSIGLEVDSLQSIKVADGVVIGYVESCERHPDADKLSVCSVDVGAKKLQIVCGASNVRAGIHVAVATVGATLPGDFKIKDAKLRGMESIGMICSAKELGLADVNDGIMVLDSSIGELKLGKNLNEYPLFDDDIIEIELTPNRGDCLSINGVARDLHAALSISMREKPVDDKADSRLGIGRILQLESSNTHDADLLFGAVDIKSVEVPFLIAYRLAVIGEQTNSVVDAFLKYATHATGVILRAYPIGMLSEQKSKVSLTLDLDESGFVSLFGKQKISTVGVNQCKESNFTNGEDGVAIIEASYIPPQIISEKMGSHKIESDYSYYRSSRGSEPVVYKGINYINFLFERYSQSVAYGGCIESISSFDPTIISISEDDFELFIGQEIDKTKITQILKSLGMEVSKPRGGVFAITVPKFRHDIVNKQDIVEEIVRIVGIDNIISKPIVFAESNRFNSDLIEYKKQKHYRHKAAHNGFFESVHFVFNEREQLLKYNFSCVSEDKELLNPIVSTLDTLRPTLLMGLLNSASQNIKNSKDSIRLFEAANIFDKNRDESKKISFIYSGDIESDRLSNGGKPRVIDFASFSQKIGDVIGSFTMQKSTTTHKLSHPYICADIIIDGEIAGEIFKLHPSIAEEFDLPDTFMCEISMDKLPFALIEAKGYSKYQASDRDLSVVVDKNIEYKDIKSAIKELHIAELVRFYPIDRYVSSELGDSMSLSIRFVLQSDEKTLEEEQIESIMSSILETLESRCGAKLR